MLARWQVRSAARPAGRPTASATCICQVSRWLREERRYATLDHRNRWSNVWTPAPKVKLSDAKRDEESHAKLVRAGFFRQAHSGVFHMLPLGLRVQDKIEAVVDKHMKSIGCSRVSLSTISSEKLWARSGRLQSVKGELFQLSDRKNTKYLLSPTHEEEITELVSQNIRSYRDLPLRLYQITRKYRDEMRPRHGILRSREFIMKDLYSFDASVEDAMATYEQVRGAYAAIFAELKVPVLAARASSGDMGGDLSHEYHLPASLGEDFVAHCGSCNSTANLEVLAAPVPDEDSDAARKFSSASIKSVEAWRGITKDRQTLVNVWYPSEVLGLDESGHATAMTDEDIDIYAIKAIVPDLDASIEDIPSAWFRTLTKAQAPVDTAETGETTEEPVQPKILNLVDWRLRDVLRKDPSMVDLLSWPYHRAVPSASVIQDAFDISDPVVKPLSSGATGFNFMKVRTGDDCTTCGAEGSLVVDRAIELGHTFYLGTRYTSKDALDVEVSANTALTGPGGKNKLTPLMGCYGLGISRILGAVADHLADAQGLNWPRAIAPYEVVVLADVPKDGRAKDASSGTPSMKAVAERIYDELAGTVANAGEVLLDDRENMALSYKLKDIDVVGYPVVVVAGKGWKKSMEGSVSSEGYVADGPLPQHGVVEVQCRQLGVKQDVEVCELREFVSSLLEKL
ncbi:prolyl-trna synthetase [Ophiostoma piceae UAMH 11346]|uniref:proline--tRNA ligase n=1 Tax=Ophiostoma piceae (strain UAMH 11346) TaxID=1262450 RepID=S3CRG4_OPHP1|nr:prolyl-trna synthetase [Ophiostoma piceae UAMH 11346]